MLERLTMPGIELPRLYIAENKADAELAKQKGVPFVRWKLGKEKLIAMLLMPTLKKMFPHISWHKVVGLPRVRSVNVEVYSSGDTTGTIALDDGYKAGEDHATGHSIELEDGDMVEYGSDIASDYRQFCNDGKLESTCCSSISLAEHVGDLSSQVNIDILQNLKLMPKFIGDIMDCIKVNAVAGTLWSEGWNKKKGMAIGNFDRTGELPNLIIVDISGSIPIGISSTMLMLVDTLRTQVHADVIITGSKSRWYPYEKELPDPQEIRNTIGRSNEGHEFCAILRDHIMGHHWGHVISFGDNDCPGNWLNNDRKKDWKREKYDSDELPSLPNTTVEHVHHYHTVEKQDTGYALWCNDLANEPVKSHDTSWCNVIMC